MDLDQLRKIRSRRMEKHLPILQEKRSAVQRCEQHLQTVKQELENYQQVRLQKQEQAFKALQSQPFTPEGMREYQTNLANLLQQEEFLKEKITQAESQLEAARQAFEVEQTKANELSVQHEKSKEIIEMDKKKARLEAERKEHTAEP